MTGTVASVAAFLASCTIIILSFTGHILNGPRDRTVPVRLPLDVYPWTPPENPPPILSAPRICAGRPVAPNFWDWQ